MPTEFILGPSIDGVVEPSSPPPVPPGRVGISFAEPATNPGGVVNFAFNPHVAQDILPVAVYAFFVPAGSEMPDQSALTPEWFFASGHPHVSYSVTESVSGEPVSVTVPGVNPGVHYVQTILEYQLF